MNYVQNSEADSKENYNIVTTTKTSVNPSTKTSVNTTTETSVNPTTNISSRNPIKPSDNPSQESFRISTTDEVLEPAEDRKKKGDS